MVECLDSSPFKVENGRTTLWLRMRHCVAEGARK